jgi:hypothetical protein
MRDWSNVIAAVAGLLLLSFLLGRCEARAEETKPQTWGVATIASYHANREVKHNERNWGLGLEHDLNDKWRFAAGGYRNSYWRDSVYVGALWLPAQSGNYKFGVLLGAVTGYDHVVGPFAPTVLPTLMYEGKQWGANLGVMPSPARGVGVLGLQLKWRFQ